MQSVYRGHRSRRLVKIMKRETPMRLTDEEFGYSVEGNYENEVVRQKIQALGQFEAQETPRGEENETAGVKLEYRKM